MANAAITAWLKSPDPHYETGVILFNQFGKSGLLKTFFSTGKGNYHLSRLKAELAALNEQLPAQAVSMPMITPAFPPGGPTPAAKKIHSLTDSEWDKAPERVKDLYTGAHKVKSHAELLHHQIRVAGSPDQRLAMALQLLEARDVNNANWAQIREYNETGKVAEEVKTNTAKAVNDMSVAELTAIVRNYPSYISRDSKKLNAMAPGEKKDKLEAKIRENQVVLEQAKERLMTK